MLIKQERRWDGGAICILLLLSSFVIRIDNVIIKA